MAAHGHARLSSVVGTGLRAALVEGIDRILAEGLPAVFLYLDDPIWQIGQGVRDRISALTGTPYSLAADVWAWRIPAGEQGWPPHRGFGTSVLDRHAPELINVWIALSDVAADQSCMHVVPLDADPSYPDAMDCLDAPLQTALALPAEAGVALVWNANILHWGGPNATREKQSRVSCSFSLVRSDAVDFVGLPIVQPETLAPRPRVDLVAMQVATYGEGKADVQPAILEWARATSALNVGIDLRK